MSGTRRDMAALARGRERLQGQSMIRKSGNHFCAKIMLKLLISREFLSTR
jgi:hypothetical protein